MEKIKSFFQFISEEVSGTEIPTGPGGSFGPAFGETRLQNKTVSSKHTSSFRVPGFSKPNSKNELTSDIFFEDEYDDIYNNYLKSGGNLNELTDDRASNVTIMMDYLQNQ
jgi:hypothetical protein